MKFKIKYGPNDESYALIETNVIKAYLRKSSQNGHMTQPNPHGAGEIERPIYQDEILVGNSWISLPSDQCNSLWEYIQ